MLIYFNSIFGLDLFIYEGQSKITELSHNFQKCGILTCVDSDEPVQSPCKIRNLKCFSDSSLTVIEYSSEGSDHTAHMGRLI